MNPMVQNAVLRWRSGGDSAQFWVLQIVGWTGLSIISYFSLNLWYNQPELAYVGHNIGQSLLGMFLSWPLRRVYQALWTVSMLWRTVLISATVLLISVLWAASRLVLFQVMTGEQNLWLDFGGWLFASIFVFLCWTALYHGIKYYRLAEKKQAALLVMASARNAEATKAARAEAAAREAQLEMLRYQLNPHFLFNTLNAIQCLVVSRQAERATDMISSLSDFLRYSLYGDSQGDVTVAQELEVLQHYLEIEQARFGERLQVEIHTDEAAREQFIPCMLLQPLVENAIKHAIAPSEDAGLLRIEAFCADDRLTLQVIDSGPGPRRVQSPADGGVGLNNIRQRLENHYGAAHEFTLLPRPEGGLRAVIRLPRSHLAQTA